MNLLKVRDVAAKEVEQFYFKMGRPINIESVLAEFEKISPIIMDIKISILDNFTWVDDQYQKMIDQGRKHEVITECQEQYDSCSLRLMSEDGFYNSMNDPRESLIELNIRCYDAFAKEFSHQYLALQSETKVKALPPQPIVKQKPELKIDQIALKYAYEGLQITRENGNEIAKKYGHNSGEKLFQRFTYFSSSANRKGKPNLCTPKKLDNKIKLIESIIELLPTDKQERAKDEVSILKKIYEAEYQ